MPSLDDIRALGYEVGVAHGSVAREEAALAAAVARATPERVELDAAEITRRAMEGLQARVPSAALLEKATLIAASALEQTRAARDEQVAFHERALEIARTMPTVYCVSGYGSHCYVAADEETGAALDEGGVEILTALSDPDAHRERKFQHCADDEVVRHALELRRAGKDVVASAQDDGKFSVSIDGGKAITTKAALLAVPVPEGG